MAYTFHKERNSGREDTYAECVHGRFFYEKKYIIILKKFENKEVIFVSYRANLEKYLPGL